VAGVAFLSYSFPIFFLHTVSKNASVTFNWNNNHTLTPHDVHDYNMSMSAEHQIMKSVGIKRIALVCIAVLLVSIFAVALHSHADGESHDDCSICMALHLSFSIPDTNLQLYVITVNHSFPSGIAPTYTEILSDCIASRAPPA